MRKIRTVGRRRIEDVGNLRIIILNMGIDLLFFSFNENRSRVLLNF